MRAPELRRVLRIAAVLALLAVGGCAAGEPLPRTPPATSAPPTTPATPSAPVSDGPVPDDGVSLQRLGYLNGPAAQFSLPRTALLRTVVDQPNNVTAVFDQPPPVDVAAYLRRTLPATGFTVTDEDPAGLTLTFVGHGWTGSFTANASTSAILLRPA